MFGLHVIILLCERHMFCLRSVLVKEPLLYRAVATKSTEVHEEDIEGNSMTSAYVTVICKR